MRRILTILLFLALTCSCRNLSVAAPVAKFPSNVEMCARTDPLEVSDGVTAVAERWYKATGVSWKPGKRITTRITHIVYGKFTGFFERLNDKHCELQINPFTPDTKKATVLAHEYGHALAGRGHPENGSLMRHEDPVDCISLADLEWICERRQCVWMKPECGGQK